MLYTVGELLKRSVKCTHQGSNANRPANTKWEGRGVSLKLILTSMSFMLGKKVTHNYSEHGNPQGLCLGEVGSRRRVGLISSP